MFLVADVPAVYNYIARLERYQPEIRALCHMLLTQDYIRALNLRPTFKGLHRQQRIIMCHFIPPILLVLLLRHPIRHHKTPLIG